MLQEIWNRRPHLIPGNLMFHREELNAAGLKAAASLDRSGPWPHASFHDYSAYHRTGNRTVYEAAISARLERLIAATSAVLDGDSTALADVADGLWLLCEQSTWCWPAHEEFSSGHVTPDTDRPTIDLGAGELVSALAWCVGWLESELDEHYPGLTERVRAEANRRIFQPFLNRDDWHWRHRPHNWNPWIHSNIIASACILAPHSDLESILTKAVDGLDFFLSAVPADGAIDEGWEYWWNGVGRLLDALEILERIGGVDFSHVPLLAATLRFPFECAIAYDADQQRIWYASFSDSRPFAQEPLPWSLLYRWATKCDLPDVANFAVAQYHEFAHFNLTAAAEDSAQVSTGQPKFSGPFIGATRLYSELADSGFSAAVPQPVALPGRSVFPSLDIAITRTSPRADHGFTVVGKGGHNNENHNQNDLGSFTVFHDGLPVAVDIGRAIYDAKTFSPQRYELWYTNSFWHNTPNPRGLIQQEGANWRAPQMLDHPLLQHSDLPGTSPGDSGRTLLGTWDLSAAYPLAADESWTRQLSLLDGNHCVLVSDIWELRSNPTTEPTSLNLVVWGAPSPADPSQQPPDRTVITLRRPRGSAITLTMPTCEVSIEPAPAVDSLMHASWGDHLHRITLTVPQGRTDFWLTLTANGDNS